jgi:putative CocE/NonD family hydrolase
MGRLLAFSDEHAGSEQTEQVEKNIDFEWGLKIPMRDGVRLNATLYRPKSSQPTPVIFTLTPYIADSYHPRALYFARQGYAFALVDCRGRGNSEGEFEPFINESRDGHDIVEWLAAQPWCDGQVTMWGGSYAGFDQWMTLREKPAQLKTIVPAAAAHPGVDFPFSNNIFYSYDIQWLTHTSGQTGQTNLFGEWSFWREKFAEYFEGGKPFKELDQIVGNLGTHFQTWLQHPTPDAYWDQMAFSGEDYDQIEIPILTITGHYDGDQPGALHFYRQHMASDSPAKQEHYLVIGPWDHPGTRTPAREFGGLKFGEASMLDMNELHKAWYDWRMKGGPRPEFLKQRVAYYLMGAEEWKYADSLEAIPSQPWRLYLNASPGQANEVFHSGRLEGTRPGSSQPDRYVYDPLDISSAQLEMEEIKDYYTDQRFMLNLSGDGLVYHSAPFSEDTEITGYAKFVAWIEMDVPDTDFQVTLSEILLDGSHILLTQDMLRARYRNSLRQERLVTTGEVNRYEFDDFMFFSRRIAKGSRLRLVINCLNSMNYEKNYNSGGVVADETARDARRAQVILHHDEDHPSYLEVPVVR